MTPVGLVEILVRVSSWYAAFWGLQSVVSLFWFSAGTQQSSVGRGEMWVDLYSVAFLLIAFAIGRWPRPLAWLLALGTRIVDGDDGQVLGATVAALARLGYRMAGLYFCAQGIIGAFGTVIYWTYYQLADVHYDFSVGYRICLHSTRVLFGLALLWSGKTLETTERHSSQAIHVAR